MSSTKPDISPAFTIKDIHKVREWHYNKLKDATVQERLDFYNRGMATIQRHVAMHTQEIATNKQERELIAK